MDACAVTRLGRVLETKYTVGCGWSFMDDAWDDTMELTVDNV